ncbi:DUF2142 domain-containing protein [Achromobacter denitrificans]|uniref:DUF2142 domain-containing protein n=1 Tax=Achromobacter denitrificans TaxID=32002 RepID=UPI0029A2A686|nr:DUF2142 domain-containing protein [Achromobacter sp.]
MSGSPLGGGAFRSFWVALAAVLAIFTVFNRLVPPMQSPDEPVHIMRAYLLSEGVVFLHSQDGRKSGGMIDPSLTKYVMDAQANMAAKPSAKVSAERINALSSMTWSGKREFFEIPTTSYYFPAIYLPQAIGLALGEALNFSVQQSYYLARYSSFLAAMAAFMLAISIFPTNPLTVGLLIIPMTVFQLMGAGMDGFSLALTILVVSIFLRLAQREDNRASQVWSYLLVALIFILATSRIQIASFVLMPFALALVTRRMRYFWQGVVVTICVLGWLAVTIAANEDGGMQHAGYSHMEVLRYYLGHPRELLHLIFLTVIQPYNRQLFVQQFVGVLGWLDTWFQTSYYYTVWTLLLLVGVLSVSFKNLKQDWLPRLALVVMSLSACFTIYFALLVQWNKFPTDSILGVQGRYFTIPIVALAYAASGDRGFKTTGAKISVVLLVLIAMLTLAKMPQLLLDRYFIG